MAVAPITPQEAREQRVVSAPPDYVIEAVNELIVQHYREGGFNIPQDEIINLALKKAVESKALEPEAATYDYLFKHKCLNFEGLYGKAGWKVTYGEPDQNGEYGLHFRFKKIN